MLVLLDDFAIPLVRFARRTLRVFRADAETDRELEPCRDIAGVGVFHEERYRFFVSFDAAPERMHDLNHEMMHALDSLRTHGVTAAEATRAATVQRRQLETRLQSNDFWMNTIGSYSRLGIPLDKIPAPFPEREVSPAELMAAAKLYLPGDVYIHLTAMPQDSTSYAKHDSAP